MSETACSSLHAVVQKDTSSLSVVIEKDEDEIVMMSIDMFPKQLLVNQTGKYN